MRGKNARPDVRICCQRFSASGGGAGCGPPHGASGRSGRLSGQSTFPSGCSTGRGRRDDSRSWSTCEPSQAASCASSSATVGSGSQSESVRPNVSKARCAITLQPVSANKRPAPPK
jgi:hypothetical protein